VDTADGPTPDLVRQAFAEQVAVDAPVHEVTWLFEGENCEERLSPLMGIAWHEGLGSLRSHGPLDPSVGRPEHALAISPAPSATGAAAEYVVHWVVLGAPQLFASLTANVSVRPTTTGCVVAARGTAFHETGYEHVPGITRRPAEAAVRALLGHLRNAVEAATKPSVEPA
jgi:hypothetical protein